MSNVYINQNGQYARLHDDPDACGVKVVDTLDEASVITPAQKDALDCTVRRVLNREFTALPATEQRTVRLETGTPLPYPGVPTTLKVCPSQFSYEYPQPVRTHIAGENLRPGDVVVEADTVERLRTLLMEARSKIFLARMALTPVTNQYIDRSTVADRLEAVCDTITEELER